MLRFAVLDSSKNIQSTFERPNFSDEQRNNLQEFLDCSHRLNASGLASDWSILSNFSIHFGKDGQIRSTSKLPPDEQIEAFLHRLRPIYLNDERTNFNRIANLISVHLGDKTISETIRAWKREYDGRMSQQTFTIATDSAVLNSPEFLDNYLNALEYHRDKDRREKIQEVTRHFPSEVQKPIVILMLFFRLSAINRLAHLIGLCLESEQGKQIHIQLSSAADLNT